MLSQRCGLPAAAAAAPLQNVDGIHSNNKACHCQVPICKACIDGFGLLEKSHAADAPLELHKLAAISSKWLHVVQLKDAELACAADNALLVEQQMHPRRLAYM